MFDAELVCNAAAFAPAAAAILDINEASRFATNERVNDGARDTIALVPITQHTISCMQRNQCGDDD